jgi:hypothetical protein
MNEAAPVPGSGAGAVVTKLGTSWPSRFWQRSQSMSSMVLIEEAASLGTAGDQEDSPRNRGHGRTTHPSFELIDSRKSMSLGGILRFLTVWKAPPLAHLLTAPSANKHDQG